jgi:hypothetical protein
MGHLRQNAFIWQNNPYPNETDFSKEFPYEITE